MLTFVTAEIGINHNGDIKIAKKLIDIASDAGCDAVKFQKRSIEKVYSQKTLDAPRESPWGTTQREQKAGLELSEKDYKIIDNYCRKKQGGSGRFCLSKKSKTGQSLAGPRIHSCAGPKKL